LVWKIYCKQYTHHIEVKFCTRPNHDLYETLLKKAHSNSKCTKSDKFSKAKCWLLAELRLKWKLAFVIDILKLIK